MWCVSDGVWCVSDRVWCVSDGVWCVSDRVWCVSDGVWCVSDCLLWIALVTCDLCVLVEIALCSQPTSHCEPSLCCIPSTTQVFWTGRSYAETPQRLVGTLAACTDNCSHKV